MTGAHPRNAARRLAQRLLALRSGGLRSGKVPQKSLAQVLKVSAPLVSSWERLDEPVTPPARHLEAYALFFATERSAVNGRYRMVARDQLTPEEEHRRVALEAELMGLRAAVVGAEPAPVASIRIGEGPWRFTDGNTITIVCAELPRELRTRYADPDDPDYIKLYTYADLDALLELHGHIRASNPDTQVYVRLASELVEDDYTTHLVLLGGVDWNPITRHLLHTVRLPVKQISFLDDPHSAAFEVQTAEGPRLMQPTLVEQGGKQVLVEDVGHFFRGPNPFNRRRTVTLCNGMFGRGTYGVVRALTDARFRDRNAEYLHTRFQGSDTYSVLMRVRILGREVLTPDWTAEDTVQHEWPETTA